MPITWNNINSGSLEGALNAMARANETVNGGFNSLQRVLAEQQAASTNAEASQNEAAQLDYKTFLQGFQSPEQLAAARTEGVFQRRLEALSPKVRGAVLGADEARLTSLRQGVTAGNAFDESVLATKDTAIKRATDPIREQYRLAVLNKDEGQQKFLRDGNPQLKDWSALIADEQATERKFAVQAREDALAPITQANAIAQGKLTGLQLASETTKSNDTNAVNKVLNNRLQQFTNSNAQYALGISETAKRYGIPLGADGMPEIPRDLDPKTLAAFNAELTKSGLNTPPSTSAVRKQIQDELISAGVSPAALAQAGATVDATFTSRGKLSAEDQAALDQRTGLIDVKAAEATKKNLFYTPPKELNQMKIDVLTKVESVIQDGPRTKTSLRQKMTNWMDSGIKLDSKSDKLTQVPPKVIEAALSAGLETDTWMVNSTDTNMERIIKDIMTSSNYDDMRKEADYLNADGPRHDKDKLTGKVRSAAGIVSPADWFENFNKTLTQRKAEAETAKLKAKGATGSF